MRIAILTNSADPLVAAQIEAYTQMGHDCMCCHFGGGEKPAGVAWGPSDAAGEACRQAEIVLAVVDSLCPGPRFVEFVDMPAGIPLVMDICRTSLKVRNEDEYAIKRFVLCRRPAVVCRNERQLEDLEKVCFPVQAMVCTDMLEFEKMPERTLVDTAWFLSKVSGKTSLAAPPSSFLRQLLGQAWGDPVLTETARSIAGEFPLFAPARIYLEGEEAARRGQMDESLDRLLEKDQEGWMSRLSLARGAVAEPMATELAQLRSHLFSAVPPRQPGKKRILLCVGRKQRDLFIVLLLRLWLERMGYETFVRPSLNRLRESLVELLPHAVVWGERTTPFKFELARFARARNVVSIVRREEAGHTYSSWEYADEGRKGWWIGKNDYSDIVDLEIMSGPESADVTSTFGYMPQEATISVGAMLFDIYRMGSLSPYLPSREAYFERHGLDPEKPVMIFCARWAHADRDPATAIPESARKKGRPERVDPMVEAYVGMCKKGRAIWLDALDRLYGEMGDRWNFIMRPHPGERVEAYTAHFKERGMNVPVIMDEYMPALLSYVDLIIHAGSTTALEGHFLSIPALSFADPAPGYLPISRLSPSCQEYGDLKKLINGVELGRSNADEAVIGEITRAHYGQIDGLACKRAAQAIHEEIEKSRRVPFRLPSDAVVPYEEGKDQDWIFGNVRLWEVQRYSDIVSQLVQQYEQKLSGEEQ